jgi:hypothetical protein
LVLGIHKIDVVENPPRHLAPVEVAQPVGGQVGDFDFQLVATRAG